MRIDVIRYEPYTLSLRPFKFFFQHAAPLIFIAAKLFHQVMRESTNLYVKLRPFRIHNDRCFETFNLLHVSSGNMRQ